MYKTFKHMGKIGDIIFSLPTIRELGGGILYIPENTPDECTGMYSALKDLLLLQPYIHEVREYPSGYAYMEQAPGIHIDYDLDDARKQPAKGRIHIVKRYMDQFEVNYLNWKEPWLVVDDKPTGVAGPYTLVSYTGRHIKNERGETSRVDWKRVIQSIKGQAYFIGLPDEYGAFRLQYDDSYYLPSIPYLRTKNMLEVARLIRDCDALYCNQSSALAIAQGLSKTYHLDVKPGKTNCLMRSPNEYILL